MQKLLVLRSGSHWRLDCTAVG